MDTFIINNGPVSNSLWGISYDTIFTTLITIFIFLLGFWINKIFEARKEKKRLKDIKDYFFSLCSFLEKPVKIQIDVFKGYKNNFLSEEQINFMFKDTIDLDVKNLKSISNEDLYKSLYLSKKNTVEEKTTKFNDISNSINYIEKQKVNTSLNFSRLYEDFKKYENQWTENLDKILRAYDNFRAINKQYDILNDPFLVDIDRVLVKWSKLENSSNIYVTFRELVTPLRLICKKFFEDPRSLSLLNISIQASYAFNSIDKLRKEYGNLFDAEAKELNSKYSRLMEALKYFQ
ncbi:MAG: hypothetical protein HYS24_15830 [Ignavibacteriales bacterium]|nr:hypothetical protein [Ignavibacteriales bacterium]